MAIRYRIVGNPLTPGAFMPRTMQGRRVGLDAMVPNIVARTSLSAADVRGVIIALNEELQSILAAGDTAVIEGLATFSIGLSGRFASPDIVLTRDTAQANLLVRADTRLQQAALNAASYEKMSSDVKMPVISSFYDVASAGFDRYTPGSIVRLQGDNLKFNAAKDDEGVFLRNSGGEVRLLVYSVTGERQIDALMPTELQGAVDIIVRARYTPNGTMREGRLPRSITPAAV